MLNYAVILDKQRFCTDKFKEKGNRLSGMFLTVSSLVNKGK